MNSQKSLK